MADFADTHRGAVKPGCWKQPAAIEHSRKGSGDRATDCQGVPGDIPPSQRSVCFRHATDGIASSIGIVQTGFHQPELMAIKMPMQTTSLNEVTSWLKDQLRKEKAPWIKPWADLSVRIGGQNFPINGWPSNIRSPGSYYGPLNMLLLMQQLQARKENYRSDLWITPDALEKLGIKISKERPYKIFTFFPGRYGGYAFTFREVFHVEQFDNCEKTMGFSFVDFETGKHGYSYERSKNARDALEQKHGLHIREGRRYAAFHLDTECVSMPGIGRFIRKHGRDDGEAHYWATMWHEVVHWTGHRSRLDRTLTGIGRDKAAYALEELVAEIGSAYLCANFGIEGKLQHAQYMKSWLKVLEDKGDEALAEAFVNAQKAAKWVLKESRKQRQRANEGRFGNFQDEAY